MKCSAPGCAGLDDLVETDCMDKGAAATLPLCSGVVATVAQHHVDCVLLSIVDEVGTTFTIRLPSQAASDLAVALVNAANGM